MVFLGIGVLGMVFLGIGVLGMVFLGIGVKGMVFQEIQVMVILGQFSVNGYFRNAISRHGT